MKKIFLFIAIASISISSFANSLVTTTDSNEPINNITINLNSDSLDLNKIELNFDSKEDLMNYDLESGLEKYDLEAAECTASISVTESVGVDSTYVSVTVTAEGIPCSEIVATVKKLKQQIQDAIE